MKPLKIMAISILIAGFVQLSQATYILSKAYLAEHLINTAWKKTLKTQKSQSPWSWSDTYPIAEIHFPAQNKSQIVLERAIGRNLAFGPSRISNSGKPGEKRSTVISAHNDTHFYHLKDVKIGQKINIETINGKFQYKISNIKIVSSITFKLPIRNYDELILTTCFPFNQIQSGTDQRLIVQAQPVI